MVTVAPDESHPHETAHDRRLQAAREAYPDWDITAVFGGFLAVPKGTPVLQSMFVDGLVEKIREQGS
jgi:hypothetical protein